jgi:hypothetical protein
MCEKPYHLEPGFEETSMRGSDPRDVKNYNDCITHETLRVAVVMMVREGPQHMLMSPMLRSVVRVSTTTDASAHTSIVRHSTITATTGTYNADQASINL